MKLTKEIKAVFVAASIFSAFSCASTGNIEKKDNIETLQKTEYDNTLDEVIDIEDETDPAEQEFYNSIQDLQLSVITSPKVTNVNKAFSDSYTVIAKKSDGSVLSDFNISVSYPSGKNGNDIEFSTETLTTNEEGKVVFTPAKPSFAANAHVIFYPTPFTYTDETVQKAMEKSVKAEWKVKSNLFRKGAILFIWDYNEKGIPVNNSYEITSEIRGNGITMVGNAPVNESSDISKPVSQLYKENYEIVEDNYGYFIYGSVKFEKPVEAVEGVGFKCTLVADIGALNMKNGNEIYSNTFTYTAEASSWPTVVSKCKKGLAKLVVENLLFGL